MTCSFCSNPAKCSHNAHGFNSIISPAAPAAHYQIAKAEIDFVIFMKIIWVNNAKVTFNDGDFQSPPFALLPFKPVLFAAELNGYVT